MAFNLIPIVIKGDITQRPVASLPHHPPQSTHNNTTTEGTNNETRKTQQHKIMDLNVEFCDETHVIEVALADTVEDMRRKVASAVGMPEDSFDMSFGDEVMGEGADMTQLSAGDTILVKKSNKQEAIAALRALGETDLRPERLEEVEDPEVACLLLQAEVATVIPCWFLAGTSITRLDLSAVSTVTRIEAEFLHLCTNLTAVDLCCFNSLTHVEYGFLQYCGSLTALDLSSFNSLARVGDDFLMGCEGLTSFDVSFNSLTHVGCTFLRECSSLTSVDLSSCKNVTHIDDGFLMGCTSLTALDLSSFSSLECVNQLFLRECTSLTSLDLSSLRSLKRIDGEFLKGCTSLTALDLSSLSSLEHIENCFLDGCSSLTALDLSSLSSVQHISHNFCEGTNLQTIHLSGCSAVVSSAVKKANLSDLVVQACPKRKRDESPEEDCKRPRLSQ